MASTSYSDVEYTSWAEALPDDSDRNREPASPGRSDSIWWPVALSETLKSDKPLGVSLGDQPLVLWRDAQGVARALIDQCPHRRVPLSLGRLTPDGNLQCGYHGWCFEGENGRVVRIPNMLEEQRIPRVYGAQSYGVSESGGFIRVCLNKDAPPPEPYADRLALHGTIPVALGPTQYVAMLFDDPSLLIDIPGVKITEFFATDLVHRDGVMTLDRQCVGRLHVKAIRERSRFPLVLRIQTRLATGETTIRLLDENSVELGRVDLAPTPGARGTTTLLWRASTGERTLARIRRSSPAIHIRGDLDAARIAATRPAVSIQFEETDADHSASSFTQAPRAKTIPAL